jgi:GT2 family glycosyltransferase
VSRTASDGAGTLPTLCVVIVNWNGRGVLEECLATVTASGYPGLRVIMVDNASTDDSVAFTRDRYPGVEIIRSDENRRWAGGNNLALARLRDDGWPQDQVLLLNNDTVVPAGSLEILASALAAAPGAWAATPRIVYADEPARLWYDGGAVGAWTGWVRHRGIRQLASARPATPGPVEYGTGCALLVARAGLEACGLLDEDYHFYGEDVDYCLRLRAAGGRVLHVPASVIRHKVSASLGMASPQKVYLRSRSHVKLLRRHWPRRRLPLVALAQLAYAGAHVAWHCWHGRSATAVAVVRGLLDELTGRPDPSPAVDRPADPMVP